MAKRTPKQWLIYLAGLPVAVVTWLVAGLITFELSHQDGLATIVASAVALAVLIFWIWCWRSRFEKRHTGEAASSGD